MLNKSMLLSFVSLSVLLAMILGISGCGEDPPPPPPADIVQEGLTLLQAEDYQGATGKFDEALNSDSEELTSDVISDAYVGLGWVHGKNANLPESITSFQSALSQDSQNANAHAGIAFAYLADDQYDQAIASADQALALDPNYSFSYTNITSEDLKLVLAESYYYKGDFKKAAEVIDGPEDPAELLEEIEALSGG